MGGLLAVLDDPDTAVQPDSPRHAWVDLTLLAPVPLGAPLSVTAHLTGRQALGTATGLWISVDVDAPAGPLLRSTHVVAARTGAPAGPHRGLPRPTPGRPGGSGRTRTLLLDEARVRAYRAGADDRSPVHAAGPDAIVPGLLVLLATAAAAAPPPLPCRLVARFARPLTVGVEAQVAAAPDGAGGHTLRVEAGGRRVLRDGRVGPAQGGGNPQGGDR